ncbi:hypothetical protein [Salinisphaera aquimarina]|uniref:Uncharacterized protein n=1 Tax=Salinisphaera aquimarina TaxID=2094031 RepID=A0ABV7ET99_9GAMM
MLIKLELNNIDELTDEETAGVENLFLSCAEGTHVAIADRNTLKALLNFTHLSSRALGSIRNMLSKFSFIANLEKEISFYVQISSDTADPEFTEDLWKLPLSWFSDSQLCTRTILLAENLNDAFFYAFSSPVLSRHADLLKELTVNYELVNGGGDTTADVLAHVADEKRFTICVTDSDQYSPGASEKRTARRCRAVIRACRWPCDLAVINARTVENLIPPAMVRASTNSPHAHRAANDVEYLLANDLLPVARFSDLKSGLHLSKIFSYTDQNAIADWKLLGERLVGHGQLDERCIEQWSCQHDRHNCDQNCCRIVAGYGVRTLSNLVAWLKAEPSAGIVPLLEVPTESPLRTVADRVVELCLAMKIQRV